MNTHTLQLQTAIAPFRQQITGHGLYRHLNNVQAIQAFTETHVFAVWDFMSLLKGLQQHLTCTKIPWVPVGSADTRYLINEIVIGEESDIDMHGKRCSHFEMYLTAMNELGANTSTIGRLLTYIQNGVAVTETLQQLALPAAVQNFVNYTFNVAAMQPVHVQAAVFTFGREDLIPDMFYAIVKDLNEQLKGKLNGFDYYLQRHIEVDGDHHSHLAIQMVEELCGNDVKKWEEATIAVSKALQHRKFLWDCVEERVIKMAAL